jgi:TonB family protein
VPEKWDNALFVAHGTQQKIGMNRLEKKCFIASACFHLSLVVILLVGPAFLSSKPKVEQMNLLDVIPSTLVDSAMNKGGVAHTQPPPPAPPQHHAEATSPKAAPKPVEKAPDPEPPKEVVKQHTPDPDYTAPPKPPKKKLPEVSTTPIVRKTPTTKVKPVKQDPDPAEIRAQEIADVRRKVAEAIGSSTHTLNNKLSAATAIDLNSGPGGGGEVMGNYDNLVRSIYEHAWNPPDDTASDDAITKVTITIASDGTVISSHIVRPSGDTSVDRSVERTLARVTTIAPFPAGSKDRQRTYTINFNLKAKRLLG